RDPHNVTGYVGLACHQTRTGDAAGGVATVARALGVCGRKPELVTAMARLLRESDPQAGLRFLQQALDEESLTPQLCRIYADLAQKAGRPDFAREACRRALRLDPNLVWPRQVEGDILLRLEKADEAAATLKPIRAELTKDPAGCALYVRALCACGSYQLAEEFIEQVKAE